MPECQNANLNLVKSNASFLDSDLVVMVFASARKKFAQRMGAESYSFSFLFFVTIQYCETQSYDYDITITLIPLNEKITL